MDFCLDAELLEVPAKVCLGGGFGLLLVMIYGLWLRLRLRLRFPLGYGLEIHDLLATQRRIGLLAREAGY